MPRQPEIEAAYEDWAERLLAESYVPYLLTFMFQPLGGSLSSMGERMLDDIERVYRIHVTRVVRKPNAPAHLDERPIWLCSLDLPVFKHAKQSRLDVLINDGLHAHAVGFYAPRSRLREGVVEHFEHHHDDLYVRREHPLMRIDVEPITHRTGYVVGYVRKNIGRGLISADATRVLPVDRRTARATSLSDRASAPP
ncbi:hypothetical protein GOFOIKOB_1437 [Methylobacterium tardum]|uniref:Uncharacterized protein n=1 Tax=Methylobacterium tardum TaxID=374432 RepID=A0AA37TFS5_9HYPH|nr:hypothetical protein [Methylobacterium tardum]GJE48408.1 hypothetical protein GOFOIKOB_1437 [Methylobacterium tardum]GLS73019.1 hypothetical protein GCM10007890_50340 [Methylobacterium tardum]